VSTMRALVFLALSLVTITHVCRAAYCSGKPSPNAQPNMMPILTGVPVLLNTTANGKLYMIGTGDDAVPLLHVWGTPYQMGFAQGTLMRAQLNQFFPTLLKYLIEEVAQALSKLPTWLGDFVAKYGIEVALQLFVDMTRPYSGEYFYDELQGIADASGIDVKLLQRVHMIGEITKGACSMFGAWGAAIPVGNSLLQMRALDWDTTGPFKDYPLMTVYHPADGQAFVMVGYVGFIGALSGMSSAQMGIDEIGVSFPDATFGHESYIGTPFIFLLRDILQFDQSLNASIERICTARRTCDLILGVGDAKIPTMRSFEYSAETCYVMSDTNLEPFNETWHPRIPEIVYHGMDWLCPGYNEVLAQQLTKLYGNLTAENAIRYVTSIVQTGSNTVTYYDYTHSLLYAAYAAATGENGPPYAYDRSFVALDVTQLWAEQPPTTSVVVV